MRVRESETYGDPWLCIIIITIIHTFVSTVACEIPEFVKTERNKIMDFLCARRGNEELAHSAYIHVGNKF